MLVNLKTFVLNLYFLVNEAWMGELTQNWLPTISYSDSLPGSVAKSQRFPAFLSQPVTCRCSLIVGWRAQANSLGVSGRSSKAGVL